MSTQNESKKSGFSIGTKLGINDDAYFIEDDRIQKGTVSKIEITVEEDEYLKDIEAKALYTVSLPGGERYLSSSRIFTSLDSALEFLRQDFLKREDK